MIPKTGFHTSENVREPFSTRFEWIEPNSPSTSLVHELCERFSNLHPVIASLLVAKGLTNGSEIQDYFSTDLSRISNAGYLKDLEIATDILEEAVRNKNHIRLYGDYDVDGVSSVAMMYLFLKKLGANVDYYIPDRYNEGYGLSERGVEAADADGVSLLITLDCGIRAIEGIDRLSQSKIKTIICDHHEAGRTLPKANAILNPKQEDCSFKDKVLCGCGVALMLIRSIAPRFNVVEKDLDSSFEFAAIATCCDIVPMIGVNRAIVSKGLSVLSNSKNAGIKALLKTAGQSSTPLNVSDVVFKVGPRINAAGRLEHAKHAVELLTEENTERAQERADHIEVLNNERKHLDKKITEAALLKVREEEGSENHSATIVADSSWHKGVIGIVASRLMEVYHRPTIVFSEKEGVFTGSARSVEGFNISHALNRLTTYLVRHGGHSAAAGLTLESNNFEAFKLAFRKIASEEIERKELKPKLNLALSLDFCDWYSDNYPEFFAQLNKFRPFGPDNLPPIFSTPHCRAKEVYPVGDNHLKMKVFQDGKPSSLLPVIAFGFADHIKAISRGIPFELAYTIEENNWKGKRTIQLVAKDLRFP